MRYSQFIKFCIGGVLNTAVDYGVFYFLISFFGFAKECANIVSVLCAITLSYCINKNWIFVQNNMQSHIVMLRFALVNIVSICSSTFLIHIFYDEFPIYSMIAELSRRLSFVPRLSAHGVLVLCKLIAAPFVTLISYFGNKYYVFCR